MRILAFDTCCGIVDIALAVDADVLCIKQSSNLNNQAEELFLLLEEALQIAGWCYMDIDVLAITVGPGSFTGVRIGVAAAQGIALILEMHKKISVLTFSTMEVAAFSVLEMSLSGADSLKLDALIIQDMGKKQIYGQDFKLDSPYIDALSDIRIVETPLIQRLNSGEGEISKEPCLQVTVKPDAPSLARLAYYTLSETGGLLNKRDMPVSASDIIPIYVRAPAIGPRKKKSI